MYFTIAALLSYVMSYLLLWLKYIIVVLYDGLASGSCGLTDGSVAGDWRLPNINELLSLVAFSQVDPALPSGHPFVGNIIMPQTRWSSTTYAGDYMVA